MVKLKIISNPYRKQIRYQTWVVNEERWDDVNTTNHPHSKLLSGELSGGFFPFCVKKIVDTIIEEFGVEGEHIHVLFEGSDDEYKELEAACECVERKGVVIPGRSDKALENARDILPEVKKLFQEMNTLITQSIQDQEIIQRDLSRFTDASSDVVPICILGNYSAGKSTFINALIGSEILPNGIEPVTAKIYKISRSRYPDRAGVKCSYLNEPISILFTDTDTQMDAPDSNVLSDALNNGFEDMKGTDILLRVNKALSILNDFEKNTSETLISDLIEVDIPFRKGVLAQSQHPFVIFDTPGSNSASNAKHLAVLKEAMANMTNGLPVFLSTPDSLDSVDNENLYHIIRDLEELDSRFTMIVVNKADGPGLQRKDSTNSEESRILSQAVPRNLYSGGLFYVSSILGLGSKNNGEFLDDFYAETYDDQVYKYSNPNERRYKTLYSYNIMPAQLKRRADELALAQTDLVYANSGLFSIETEIENFAGKYASYNKCFQSQMFLYNILNITANEIDQQKKGCENIRRNIKEKLDEDKRKLTQDLEEIAENEQQSFDDIYDPFMNPYLAQMKSAYTEQILENNVDALTKEFEAEFGYGDLQDSAKKSRENVGDNIKNLMTDSTQKFGLAKIMTAVSMVKNDIGAMNNARAAQRETRHKINRAAADKLLEIVGKDYKDQLNAAYNQMNSTSQSFWTNNTEKLRSDLAVRVAGTDVLTEEKKLELEKVIITYQRLSFPETETDAIFNKAHFEYRFKLFNQVIWQSDTLNVKKLSETYGNQFETEKLARYASVKESHMESAHVWIQNLLDEIRSNIVQYSPELSEQAREIQQMTRNIEECEKRKSKLNEYTRSLSELMDWKEV